jgi:hypothetical protein
MDTLLKISEFCPRRRTVIGSKGFSARDVVSSETATALA